MADRPGLESVLARLDDMNGRLASAKSVGDLQEQIGRLASSKLVVDLQENQTKLLSDMKRMGESFNDGLESVRKDIKKLREEFAETEASEGADGETLNFLKEQIGEFKSMAKALLGDDATVEVVRNKVRDFLGGKKKTLKGAEGADD